MHTEKIFEWSGSQTAKNANIIGKLHGCKNHSKRAVWIAV